MENLREEKDQKDQPGEKAPEFVRTPAVVARQKRFLKHFAKLGTIYRACQKMKMARKVVRRWQKLDPIFMEEFLDFNEDVTDKVEGSLMDRSTEGVETVVITKEGNEIHKTRFSDSGAIYLSRLRRGLEGKQKIEHSGEVKGTPAVVYDVNINLKGAEAPEVPKPAVDANQEKNPDVVEDDE